MELVGRPFDEVFAARLREELDAVQVAQPPGVPRQLPRGLFAVPRFAGRPFALAAAAGAAVALAMTASFATGSPNPGVWVGTAARVLGVPFGQSPVASPAPPESQVASPGRLQTPESEPTSSPGSHRSDGSPDPRETDPAHQSPRPSQSPEHDDPRPSPHNSPSPSTSSGTGPSPSPSPPRDE
jgi:hypothetical protein